MNTSSKAAVCGPPGPVAAALVQALSQVFDDVQLVTDPADPAGLADPVGAVGVADAVGLADPVGAVGVAGAVGAAGVADPVGVVGVADAVARSGHCVIDDDVQAVVLLPRSLRDAGLGPDPMLDAVAASNAAHCTLVSSAAVYGAWPSSPVPISEDAPVRPNPEFLAAVGCANAERAVLDLGDARACVVALLRCAPVVGPCGGDLFGDAMVAAAPVRVRSDDPPAQFLHVDDLASAAALVASRGLSGAFNVAADGWLAPQQLRDLLGVRPKVRLPLPAPRRLDRYVAARIGSEAPAGLQPCIRYGWVVANDRLCSAGWRPRYDHAQAFIVADQQMPWDGLSAGQRQRAALLGSAAALAAACGAAAWAWLRSSERRASFEARIVGPSG